MRTTCLTVLLLCLATTCLAEDVVLFEETFEKLPPQAKGRAELVPEGGVDNSSYILSTDDAYSIVRVGKNNVSLGKTLKITFRAKSQSGATAHVYMTVSNPKTKDYYYSQAFKSRVLKPGTGWTEISFSMPLTRKMLDHGGKLILQRYAVKVKKQGEDKVKKSAYERYWVGRDAYDGPDTVRLYVGIYNLTNSKYAKPNMAFENSRLGIDNLKIELVEPEEKNEGDPQ